MDEKELDFRGLSSSDKTCFFTYVRSIDGIRHARFLIKSLRTFGGSYRDCPVLIFNFQTGGGVESDIGLDNVHVFSVDRDREQERYWFGDKVLGCSMAEEIVGRHVHSLVWLSTQCLILQPPVQFDLNRSFSAAFRPVHIKNIGLRVDEPIDSFWSGVYHTVGIEECPYSIQSFVEGFEIRPYFNTHLFSIDPSLGILQTWLEHFREMISNEKFQSGPCQDEEHQIFLHQAILSALILKVVDRERVRILPMEYSYPLHLHQEVPIPLRPASFNQLVCPVYEGVYRHPDTLNGLVLQEPLKTWMVENRPSENEG